MTDNKLLELIQSKQLSIQNILHLSVVYWNLILQLFRTNAQFKTIFQQTYLRHKLNIIFHLVYNSLSCYLFTPNQPNNNVIVESLSSVQHEPASSTATSILLNEYCWIPTTSITASNINCDSLSILYNSNNSSNNSNSSQVQQTNDEKISKFLNESDNNYCDDTLLSSIDIVYKPNGIFNICHEIDFNEILLNNEQQSLNDIISTNNSVNGDYGSSFATEYFCNNSNSNSSDYSSSYIYNLKNIKNETSLNLFLSSDSNTIHSDTVVQSSVASIDILSIGVQKLQNLISNSVYKIFYSNYDNNDDDNGYRSTTNNDSDNLNFNNRIDNNDTNNIVFAKENVLMLSANVEQKKLFLQLFEITCGVMMSDQNREARGKNFFFSVYFPYPHFDNL